MLQASSLALIGMLTVVGCGGSDNPTRNDGGKDTIGVGETNQPVPGKVAVTPAFLDFQMVDVGASSTAQAITVSVSGAAVAISPTIVGAGFALAGTTCTASQAAGTTCSISVKFAPTTVGAANGVLTIGSVTVSLSGIGNKQGVFTAPDRIDLGTLKLGATAAVTVQIAPDGTLPSLACTSSNATELAPNAAATTCPATGAVSAACVYAFTFTAATAGARTDTVTCTGGTKVTQTAVAASVVGPSVLAVSPTSALLNAVVNKTDSVVITVSNNGGSATAAAPVATITAGAADFAVTANDCVVALAPLGTCKVTVTFAPKTAGANKLGTLSVTEGTTTLTVSLNGTATSDRSVTVTPNPGDFGTVAIGASKPLAFTMKNAGGTATGAISLAGGSGEFVLSNDLCTGATLAATTGQCTFTLTFVPAAPASATAHEAIVTASDVAGPLVSVKVQGVAQAASVGAVLAVEPPTLDFGTTTVGVPVGPKVFTITNTGDTSSAALSVVKNDSTSSVGGAAQFTYTSTCASALAPKATCQVAVTYAPTIDGNASATITVTDGAVSTKASTVVGTALKKASFAVKCGTGTDASSAVAFPTAWIVGATSTETVTCTVSNAADNTQSTGTLTAAATGDFAVATAGNTCTASLSPGSSCAFNVTFKPTAKGPRTGSLTVSGANGGLVTGNITGTGLGVVELQVLTGGTCTIGANRTVNNCTVAPQPHDFGQISAGKTSTAVTVALFVRSNVGTVVMAKSLGTPAQYLLGNPETNACPATDSFVVDTAKVDPSKAYCYYLVTFQPTTKGVKAASLTATGAETSTDTASLTGTGTGPLSIAPSPVAFATVAVGSSATVPLTVTNNSTTTNVTAASYTLTGTNASEFIVIGDTVTGQTINAGAHGGLTIRFVPTSAGAKTATITVSGTYGAAGTETATVTLTGTGGAASQLTAALTTAFPPAAINGRSTGVITVTNGGGSESAVINFIKSGAEFALPTTDATRGTCGATGTTTLAAGASCTINVYLQPVNGLGLGQRTGKLTIWAAKGGIATVDLVGTATPQLTITGPTSLDYGNVVLNANSDSKTFTVTNNAISAVTLNVGRSASNVHQLSPLWNDEFYVEGGASNTCATSGAAANGGTCQFKVHMTPSRKGLAYGTIQATGTIGANPAEYAYVDLSGTGLTAASLKFTAATGMDREFGRVVLNTASAPVIYTLTNTGDVATSALSWGLFKADGTENTQDFDTTASVGTTCSKDTGLAAGATCNIAIVFKPIFCSTTTCTTTGLLTSGVVQANLVVKATNGAPADGVVARTDGTSLATVPVVHGTTTDGTTTAGLSGDTLIVQSINATPFVFPTASTAQTATLLFTAGGSVTFAADDAVAFSNAFGLVNRGIVTGAGEFAASANTCVGKTLSANDTCTFTVTWTPGATAGNREVAVAIGANNENPAAFAVAALVATRPTSAALADSGDLDFGTMVVGKSTTLTLTISNTGDLATTGNVILTKGTEGGASDVTVLTSTCVGKPLLAGASCTVPVRVTPSGIATRSVTVTATAAGASPTTAAVGWTAVAASQLTVDADSTSVDFGEVAVGATSAATTITISSVENGQLTGPLAISVNNTDFAVNAGTGADDCGYPTYAQGLSGAVRSCTIYVTFSPKALASASKSGTLTIASTNAETVTVPLAGTALAALTASGTLTFGSVAVGATASQTLAVSLRAGVLISGQLTAALSGANASEFRITADTCTGVSIGDAGYGADAPNCSVTVTFAPSSTGAKTVDLTVSGTPGDSVKSTYTGTATSAT